MRNKHIFIGIVFVILIALSGALIYINNVYLPKEIKPKLENKLRDLTGQNVLIDRLRFSIFRGLVIQGLHIFETTPDLKYTTLEAEEVSFNFQLLPILKNTIIIPSLYIESPRINLKYRKDKTFNLQDLFKYSTAQPPKWRIMIYKIRLHNGEVQFQDQNLTPVYEKRLLDLDIGIDIGLQREIKFLIEAKIPQKNTLPTKFSLSAKFDLKDKTLEARVKSELLLLSEYRPYLERLPANIVSGEISDLDLALRMKDKVLTLEGGVSAKSLKIAKDRWTLNTDAEINSLVTYDFDAKVYDYKGSVKLANGTLEGLLYIGQLKIISLDSQVIKDNLNITRAKLQAVNALFSLDGAIRNFTSPQIYLNIASDKVNLQDAAGIFPKAKDYLKMQGMMSVAAEIRGAPDNPAIKGNAEIKNAQIDLALLKEPFLNVASKLTFSEDSLNWKELTFDYKKVRYISEGGLSPFKQPQVNLKLSSKDLNLNSQFKINGNDIALEDLEVNFKDARLNATGGINISEKDNPEFDITFNLRCSPQDLKGFAPQKISGLITKLKIGGVCSVSGLANGKAKDIRGWDLSVKFASDKLSVYNLKFEDVFVDLQQSKGMLKVNKASARAYAGKINLTLLSNLEPPDAPFNMKLALSNIDLAKLKADIEPLKDKDVSGLLNADMESSGTLTDPGNPRARGSLTVKDGRLWELNIFKGLGEFLFLPSFRKVIFKDAYAEFSAENKNVYIDRAVLRANEMNLYGEGNIGFDSALDLTVTLDLNPDLIKESKDPRRFTTFLAGNFLLLKVSGTLQEPKYSVSTIPLEAIKGIKDYFLKKNK